jgi:hypothetical protein
MYSSTLIFVTDLRGEKIMKDLARHELEFWGM